MKEIYRFEVMDHLNKGVGVYALMFTEKKPIVEDAAIIPGRLLARYINTPDIKWYASEEAEDDQTEG